ncbi:septum site-determining protein Ssd [Streptomyces benahoarensis]|uniref:Septum formation initiator n=1 Tax=Streptomyces benahoarensis TaxID=2595054 RepID=A0A553ZQR5_9ACTN|nr:septum site-determining protein Ssd [Streptomyces benahoarensis]TSB32546.1 septum formation initiator [Streptomyces benahoarensis]TSB43818.1 septum formation initiator [Streptomyces benahoarensis]
MPGSMVAGEAGVTDEERPGPLLVTEDEQLLDDLVRLCAAAGVVPQVRPDLPPRGARWPQAPLVVIGEDGAARLRGAGRRDGVVLIARHADRAEVWRLAVALGAERVITLPEGERWLADRIADAVEGTGPAALTVGVLGGRGGAGASTLACALAVTAARKGLRTMLVDADPLGGGLDVLLGCEREEGLRWPAFRESRGRVASGALAGALPRAHSLRVLSWDRGAEVTIPPAAMRAVLAAARRRGGVVVVDLPRRADEAVAEALDQVDLGLLVVPAELRAVAAARRVVAGTAGTPRDLRAVVRGVPGTAPGLGDEEIAALVNLPLLGELPWDPEPVDGTARGVPPGARARGPLARFCAAFWERALPEAGGLPEGPGPVRDVGEGWR